MLSQFKYSKINFLHTRWLVQILADLLYAPKKIFPVFHAQIYYMCVKMGKKTQTITADENCLGYLKQFSHTFHLSWLKRPLKGTYCTNGLLLQKSAFCLLFIDQQFSKEYFSVTFCNRDAKVASLSLDFEKSYAFRITLSTLHNCKGLAT